MDKLPALDDSIKIILQIRHLEETQNNRLLVYGGIKEKHEDNRIEQAAVLVINELLESRCIDRFTDEDMGTIITIRIRYLGVLSEPELSIRGMDSTGIAHVKLHKDELDKFLSNEPAPCQEIEVRGVIVSVNERRTCVELELEKMSILANDEVYTSSNIEQILKTDVRPWGLKIPTQRGELVRSKAECLIADVLFSLKVEYEYEKPLEPRDPSTTKNIHPDFTLKINGLPVYWEHAGPMEGPDDVSPSFSPGSYSDYVASHDWKMNWYKENRYANRLWVTYGSIDESKVKETLQDLEKLVEKLVVKPKN